MMFFGYLTFVSKALVTNMALMALFYFLFILPLEKNKPRMYVPKKAYRFDLLFTLFYHTTSIVIVGPLLWHFRIYLLPEFGIEGLFTNSISSLPFALQGLIGLFIFDFSYYWFHRASHKWQTLWSLHVTHHTTKYLHALAGFRTHILGAVLVRLVAMFSLVFIGIDPIVLGVFGLLHAYGDAFIHINSSIRFGFLEKVFMTPHLHSWHHSVTHGDKNLALLFPVIDMIFGTYHCPKDAPPALGLANPENFGDTVWDYHVNPIRNLFSEKR